MEVTTPVGDRQGDLAAPTNRAAGKSPNFAVGWPDPRVAVQLAPFYLAVALTLARKAGADRVVAEIEPWMLAERRRQGERRTP